MRVICLYAGRTPLDNVVCNHCVLFLNTCIPFGSPSGLATGSECDCYLCEGCPIECASKDRFIP